MAASTETSTSSETPHRAASARAGSTRSLVRLLAGTRYVIVVAIVCTLVGAVTLSASGALVTFQLAADFLIHRSTDADSVKHLQIAFVEVVDIFLVALVMYMISVGFYTLFIDPNLPVPAWLAPNDIDDLKARLVGVVNVALGVLFLEQAFAWDGSRDLLSYGVGIGAVVLALTYFMAGHGGKPR